MGIGRILGKGSKTAVEAAKEVVVLAADAKALQQANKQLLKYSLDAIDDKGALKSYALGAADAMKKLEELNKKLH